MHNLECTMQNCLSILHCALCTVHLFIFSVQLVLAAATAELTHLKPVRRVLFVLGRHVVALFALRALQNDVIPRHFLTLY